MGLKRSSGLLSACDALTSVATQSRLAAVVTNFYPPPSLRVAFCNHIKIQNGVFSIIDREGVYSSEFSSSFLVEFVVHPHLPLSSTIMPSFLELLYFLLNVPPRK